MKTGTDSHAALSSQVGHAPAAHAGAPHLNPDSYASQLFWLTVTFITLYLMVSRAILPRIHEVLEKRQHHLNQDLDRAEALSGEAEEARTTYEKLQTDTRMKAQQLIGEAQASIAAMQEKKFTEVDADIQGRLSKARTDIEARRSQLNDKLAPVAKEVTALVVTKLVGAKPTDSQLDTVDNISEANKKRQAG